MATTDICFTIESVGVLTDSVDRLYHFGKGPAPSWDTDGVWVNCVQGYPGEVASEVDFGEGNTSTGGRSIVVRAGASTQGGQSVGELLYDQTRVQLASATAALANASSTPITLDATDLVSNGTQNVTWGREVMRLTSHLGSGQYAVQRGRLGTLATPHTVGLRDFTGILDADKVPILKWRRITFYRVPLSTATSYADLEALWTGFVVGVEAPSPEVIRIDADSLFSVLQRMKICRDLWQSGAPTGEPGSDAPVTRTYAGPGSPVRASAADFSVDATILATSSYTTIGPSTFVNLGPEDTALISDETPWPNDPKKAWECFHCDGDDTDTGALPLSRNVVSLALQLITTTPGGQNGDYDVGVGDLGCGVDVALVDVAAFEDARARFGDRLEQERLVLAFDGKPVDVYDWLTAKLLPYGLALVDTGTQITLAVLEDNASLVTAQLREGIEILGPASIPPRDPPFQRRRTDLDLDRAECAWGFVPGQGSVVSTFSAGTRRSINLYGDNQSREYDLEGIGAEAVAEEIVGGLIERFHDTIPEVRLYAKRGTGLAVGDLVLVTHTKIYKANGGTRSVTDAPMLVVAQSLQVDQNVEHLHLLHVGAIYGRVGLVAPSAVVESWDTGTGRLTVEPDLAGGGFQSGEAPAAVRDLSDFAVGDIVDLCDSTGAVRVAGLEIATRDVINNRVTFVTAPDTGGSPVTPVAGDVLRVSDYDRSITRQKDRYAYVADSDGVLGAFNVDGQDYTRI